MNDKAAFDVIVVGNGALGLALAHRLTTKDKTLRLAVVGPARREGAATLAAGAMLNAWGELVRNQFDFPALAERAQIRIDALGLWDRLTAELSPFAPAPLAVRWGTLVLDSGKGGAQERQSIDTMRAALARSGASALSESARGFWPPTVLIPDGWIAPAPVLAVFERALQARGAALIDGRATQLSTPSAGEWRVGLADGTVLTAGAVVLANGPFAQDLVDQVPDVRAATPRLVFEAGAGFDGEAAISAPPVDVVRTMGRGAYGGFHIITQGGGRFYLGSTSAVSLTADWESPTAKLAAARAMLADELDPGFAHGRYTPRAVGFRAVSADGFPLLGESHVKGLWFANAMQRDGFTSAPLVADGLAAAILAEKQSPFARFAPSRDLISYKTRAAALEDAVASHGEENRAAFTRVYEHRKLGDFGVYSTVMPLYVEDGAFAALDHKRSVS